MDKLEHPGCILHYRRNDGSDEVIFFNKEIVKDTNDISKFRLTPFGYIPIVKTLCYMDRDGFVDREIGYGPNGQVIYDITSPRSNCPK